MELKKAQAEDFDRIKAAYLDIIKRSPGMDRYARYEYGKHPKDEDIIQYIDAGCMYMLMDGEVIAGVSAITPFQGEEYHFVPWQIDVSDHEVLVFHMLAINPDYQGRGAGSTMIREAFRMARQKNLKTCRLDTLASNIPAQRFYEKLGFTRRGKAQWYAENTGWTDFYLYEYVL